MLRIILLFVAFSARGNAEDDYKQGLLVCETNAVAAYELFIKAVGGGSVEAMVASGYCCEEGMGVAENRSLAFRWYGMAVEKDAVKASRGLAAICSVRRGIRGNDLEARKTYFSKHGSDPATVYEHALELLADGRQLDAEDLVDRAIAAFPADQRLLFLRGVLWRSRFTIYYAALNFRAAHRQGESTSIGEAAQLMLMMDQGENVTGGFIKLRSLMKAHPEELLFHWIFAIQCRQQKRFYAEGAEAFEAILKQWNPGPVMVNHTYANLLTERLSRSEEALQHRRIALKQAERPWTYQGLANTLNSLKRYDEAEPFYANAVEMDPGDARHWRQWGLCLMNLERYSKAADVFRQGLEVAPDDLGNQASLAKCFIELGQYEDALNLFNHVLKEDAENRDALLGLATLYTHGLGVEKDSEKAAAHAKRSALVRRRRFEKSKSIQEPLPSPKVHEFDKGSAQGCLAIGNAYYHGSMGAEQDYTQAAVYYKQAVEMGESSTAYTLGWLYTSGGYGVARNLPVALEWHEWVIGLDPEKYEITDSRRKSALLEAARICAGFYGVEYADGTKALRYSGLVYEKKPSGENKMLLAMAWAANSQFDEAGRLMQELVVQAEANGHLRGLEEKKEMLELYRGSKLYEPELETKLFEQPDSPTEPIRPSDLVPREITDAMRRPAYVRRSSNVSKSSRSSQSLFREAGNYARKRDHQQALKLYQESYETEPRYRGFSAFSIGNLYARGGAGVDQDLDLAFEWFNRSMDAGAEEGYMGIITLYLPRIDSAYRDVDKALDYAKSLQATNPKKGSSFRSIAQAYAQAGLFEEAVRNQEAALHQYMKIGTLSDGFIKSLERDLEKYKQSQKPYSY